MQSQASACTNFGIVSVNSVLTCMFCPTACIPPRSKIWDWLRGRKPSARSLQTNRKYMSTLQTTVFLLVFRKMRRCVFFAFFRRACVTLRSTAEPTGLRFGWKSQATRFTFQFAIAEEVLIAMCVQAKVESVFRAWKSACGY